MNGLNLSLISHYINCKECQNHETCDIARMLVTSQSTSSGLDNQAGNEIQAPARVCASEPELAKRSPQEYDEGFKGTRMRRYSSEKPSNSNGNPILIKRDTPSGSSPSILTEMKMKKSASTESVKNKDD